jgi:hypothetical protein
MMDHDGGVDVGGSSSEDDDDDAPSAPISPTSEQRLQGLEAPVKRTPRHLAVNVGGSGATSGNTSPAPDHSDDEPMSPSINENEPGSTSTPRVHTAKKAQDVLFGGAKHKKNKVFDKLGVSQLEIDRFADQPKAHQKLGIFSDAEFKQNRVITLNTYDGITLHCSLSLCLLACSLMIEC